MKGYLESDIICLIEIEVHRLTTKSANTPIIMNPPIAGLICLVCVGEYFNRRRMQIF